MRQDWYTAEHPEPSGPYRRGPDLRVAMVKQALDADDWGYASPGLVASVQRWIPRWLRVTVLGLVAACALLLLPIAAAPVVMDEGPEA